MVRWITRFDFVLLLIISVRLSLSFSRFLYFLFPFEYIFDTIVLMIMCYFCCFFLSICTRYKDQYVAMFMLNANVNVILRYDIPVISNAIVTNPILTSTFFAICIDFCLNKRKMCPTLVFSIFLLHSKKNYFVLFCTRYKDQYYLLKCS